MIQFMQVQTLTQTKTVSGKSNTENRGAEFGGILERSKRQLSDAAQPESAETVGDTETAEDMPLVQNERDGSSDKKKKLKNDSDSDSSDGTQIQVLLCGGSESVLVGLSKTMPAMLVSGLQQQSMAGSEQTDAGEVLASSGEITRVDESARNVGTHQASCKALAGITQAVSAGVSAEEITQPDIEDEGGSTVSVSADIFRGLSRETGTQDGGKTEMPQAVEKNADNVRASDSLPQMKEKVEVSPYSASQRGKIIVSAAGGAQQPAEVDTSEKPTEKTLGDRVKGDTGTDVDSLSARSENAPSTVTDGKTIGRVERETHFERGAGKPLEAKAQKTDETVGAAEQLSASRTENVPMPEVKMTQGDASSIRPVFEQVAQKVTQSAEKAASGGEYVFDMKLFPEGLGKVEVRMVCGNGTLALTVTAHSGEAGKLLSGQADELRAALAQNYQISDLHVRVETKADVQSSMTFLANGFGTPGRSGSGGAFGQETYRYGKNETESDETYAARRSLSLGILDARV